MLYVKDSVEEEKEIFCRICKEDEKLENNPLISPCKCRGLFGYVHSKCLLHFLKNFQHLKQDDIICELCNEKYTFEVRPQKYINMCLKENSNKRKVCIFLLILLSILFISLSLNTIIKFRYNFIEIIILTVDFILIISITYIYRKMFKFTHSEDWTMYNSKLEINNNRKIIEDLEEQVPNSKNRASSYSPNKHIRKSNLLQGIISSFEKLREKVFSAEGRCDYEKLRLNKKSNNSDEESVSMFDDQESVKLSLHNLDIKGVNKFKIYSPLNLFKDQYNNPRLKTMPVMNMPDTEDPEQKPTRMDTDNPRTHKLIQFKSVILK
jgi:hypothetical protein